MYMCLCTLGSDGDPTHSVPQAVLAAVVSVPACALQLAQLQCSCCEQWALFCAAGCTPGMVHAM